MKIFERNALELVDPEWPEVLYEETDWPDEVFVKEAEKKELDDEIKKMISFLLWEGREIGW